MPIQITLKAARVNAGLTIINAANGGRSTLKSIKQDDTEFQFAVADVANTGSTVGADLESLHTRLNLYRKVWWPTRLCDHILASDGSRQSRRRWFCDDGCIYRRAL